MFRKAPLPAVLRLAGPIGPCGLAPTRTTQIQHGYEGVLGRDVAAAQAAMTAGPAPARHGAVVNRIVSESAMGEVDALEAQTTATAGAAAAQGLASASALSRRSEGLTAEVARFLAIMRAA